MDCNIIVYQSVVPAETFISDIMKHADACAGHHAIAW